MTGIFTLETTAAIFANPSARIAFAPAASTVDAWAAINPGASIAVPAGGWQETMSPPRKRDHTSLETV